MKKRTYYNHQSLLLLPCKKTAEPFFSFKEWIIAITFCDSNYLLQSPAYLN